MIASDDCAVRSPATARRCTLKRRHDGPHERRRRSGALIEVWPRVASDDDAGAGMTYTELLEHLRDLIELARSEGFGRFVGVLERARHELMPRAERRARPRRPRGTMF